MYSLIELYLATTMNPTSTYITDMNTVPAITGSMSKPGPYVSRMMAKFSTRASSVNVTTFEARYSPTDSGVIDSAWIVPSPFGMRFATELTAAGRPENVDFDDFPCFLSNLFRKTLEYHKANRSFLIALAVAAIQDRSVFEKFEEIGEKDLGDIVGFFSRFQGVDFADKGEPWLFIAKWSDVTKSIIQHHTIYPRPFDSDDELVELLVKISLMMWDYKV